MKYNDNRIPNGSCGGADGDRQRCGSVHAGNRDNVAVLGVWNDGPKLNWNWHDNANPIYGSASRGEFLA